MLVSQYNESVNTFPKNKYFTDIHQEFLENGWRMRDNTMTHLLYYNPNNLADEFKVSLENKLIYVTIPITYGNYEYKTKFKSYYLASEYISFHLNNYLDKYTQ